MSEESKPGWNTPARWADAWRSATVSPIGSAAVLGGVGALTGWLLAPHAAKLYGKKMLQASGYSPEEIQEEIDALEEGPLRWRAAIAGGLLGAGASVAHNYDPTQPWSGMQSWKRNTAAELPMQKLAQFFSSGDLNPLKDAPLIPIQPAKQLVMMDPQIGMGAKSTIMSIFNKAEDAPAQGFVSVSQLGQAAMRAGFGYAIGSTLGEVLGTAAGLPPKMSRTLARTGGIASALMNVGVLGP